VPDRIVFIQQGDLVARGFDLASGTFTGEPVTLAASVGGMATSATGIVAHRPASGTRTRMIWFDRHGSALGEVGDGPVNAPQLSPDEGRLAGDRTVGGNRDVWVVDLARGGLTRFTTDAAIDGFPVWSPDPGGSRIVFHSNRNGTFDLWTRTSSGAGADERILETPDHEWPIHWSRDGRFLLFQRSDLKARWDLWALPMTGSDRTPIAVATTPFVERMGEFSPDGQWVVYETNESGRPEIAVQAFPNSSGRWPVSIRGGIAPRWSADGGEIYFIAPDGKMMAVPVTTKGSAFKVGAPATLFSTQIAGQVFRFQYAVSRDGRFLVSQVVTDESAPPIHLILNANR
jgi:dipeptidyl aminopeptidase/acylaminoacyl peptidase